MPNSSIATVGNCACCALGWAASSAIQGFAKCRIVHRAPAQLVNLIGAHRSIPAPNAIAMAHFELRLDEARLAVADHTEHRHPVQQLAPDIARPQHTIAGLLLEEVIFAPARDISGSSSPIPDRARQTPRPD